MRILICGNAIHTSTGYGTQIKNLCKMWQSLGHEVAVLATYGVQGGMLTIEGVPHYPTFRDFWGQDAVGAVVKHFKADVVVTLHDAWVLSDGFQDRAGVPWICISPIDSVPAAPRTVAVMRQARYPVTYSKFGHDELAKAGVKSDYVPHAIDCDVFCPGDKREARRALGVPEDKFVVGMAAANKGYPSRKAFPEQLMAFAEFRKTHEDALLLLHTQKAPVGNWADGVHLDTLIKNLNLSDSIIVTNEWAAASGLFTEHDLANFYRASDVLLHASYAEGFGLCIAEAQACGCPVITTDFSSMPELTFKGICVEPSQRVWSLLGCWQVSPSVQGIVEALATIHADHAQIPESLRLCSTQAIPEIAANYSIPVVTEQWRTFLEMVESELSTGRLKSIAPELIPPRPAEYFDQLAEQIPDMNAHFYKETHDKARYSRTIALVSELAKQHGLKTALEVGCAQGMMTREFAREFDHVTAIDGSRVLLSRCPQIDNVTFEYMDAEDGLSGSYDLGIICEVLEHLRDPQKVVNDLLSRCKYVLASCPISEPSNPRTFDIEKLGVEMSPGDAAGHIWSMDERGFKSLFNGVVSSEVVDGVTCIVVASRQAMGAVGD